jgi:VWFA-related protein
MARGAVGPAIQLTAWTEIKSCRPSSSGAFFTSIAKEGCAFMRTVRFFSQIAVLIAVGSTAIAAQAPTQLPPAIGNAPDPVLKQRVDPASLAAQPAPSLIITSREVLLDLVVTDEHHHPVTGLTSADFTVTEEKQPQVLRHLEEHATMNAADVAKLKAAPPQPPNTFTNFTPVVNSNAYTVILLDALNTSIESQMNLRQQLIGYLKHMEPGTPIAIFQLDTEMRLIQGFSTDPQVLLSAAESKRDMPSLQKPIHGDRDYYLRMKNQILGEGMQSIGRYLAGFPGRKNLVWFTGSIPTWLSGSPTVEEVERRSNNPFRDNFMVYDDAIVGLTDELSLSRVAVYPIDARGLQTLPSYDASQRRPPSNLGFYNHQAFQHMQLDQIADATGGKAYYNTNGLKETLAEIVNNGSNYYTLAYATTNQKWDGKFRHIKIEVNRPGVMLQYRPGYYAVDRTALEQRQLAALQRNMAHGQKPTSAPPESSEDAPVVDENGATIKRPKEGFDAAMQLGAVPPTEIVFTASVAINNSVVKLSKNDPLPKDNYLKPEYKDKPFRKFDIAIQTDPHSLNITQSPDGKRHGSLQFVTALYTPDGEMIDSIQSTVNFDLTDNGYRELLRDGLPMKLQIAVPVKGNYFLRVGIHDLGNDRVGAVEIPVDQVHPNVVPQAMASR